MSIVARARRFGPGLIVLGLFAFWSGSAQAQGWVLSGQVQNDAGLGIPNVAIDLFQVTTGDEVVDLTGALTGAGGSFALTIDVAVPVGLYDLVFVPPAGSTYFPSTIQVFLAGSTSIPTVTLASGFHVSGCVESDLGLPLEFVDLDFFDAQGDLIATSGDFTGADGCFSVLVPPGAIDLEVKESIDTPGGPYVPVYLEAIPVSVDLDVGTLVLRDGYSLFGTVHDELSQPVVGADIDVLDPVTGDEIHTPGDFTDGAGDFSVLVPAGDFIVEVDPPTGVTLVTVEFPFTVSPPPALNDTGTTILPSGFAVTGRTVNGSGTPVAETDLDFIISSTGVEIPTAHDNAGPDGTFSVVVPANTYDIVFRPPFTSGLAPLVVEGITVVGPTSLGDVVLPSGFPVMGTVSSLGSPVALVDVTMVDTVTGDPVPVFGGESDLLGHYQYRTVGGTYDITFTPPVGSGLAATTEFDVVVTGPVTLDIALSGSTGAAEFIRGDANQDSLVNLADVIAILESLFSGSGPLVCPDAGDANDDGAIDISDPIAILGYLFTAGSPPPAPFPGPGVDPTADALVCP